MVTITPSEAVAAQSEYSTSRTVKTPSISKPVQPMDVVAISDEAQQRFRTDIANHTMIRDSYEEEEETDGSAWTLASGLKEGEFTLDNGNTQKVSIDDGVLTIEEFQNGRLIKSVIGTINKNGAVLDTEYFDAAGRVSQSIHTELSTMEAADGWTAAVMSRDVKWYEGGELKGEMHDNMQLQTWNSTDDFDEETADAIKYVMNSGTKEVNTDIDALADLPTIENHAADYFAQIKEYGGEGGKLVRDIIVEQTGRYKQLSNRSAEKMGGVAERSTVEMEHETGLRIEIKEYDENGDLVKESRFTDSQKDKENTVDGQQEQTVAVSWYNKGELVKRSHGTMTLDETETKGLPDRPGFLELFGMDDEEYLGDGPKSAMEHMSTKLMTSSAEADFFMEGLSHHINGHDYSTAEGIARWGENGRPYSISWTDEIYRDGDLVARQKDTEGASPTSFWQRDRGLLFRKGAALTENENPVVLRESSHEREIFENGRTKSHQSMDAREWVNVDMDGPDELRTTATFRQGLEGREDVTIINGQGGIEDADPDTNAAAHGYANEAEQTLDTLHDMVKSLNEGETDKALDHRARFNFKEGSDD